MPSRATRCRAGPWRACTADASSWTWSCRPSPPGASWGLPGLAARRRRGTAVGFSGGALLDTEGRIIGINTTGLARGAGLTIPAPTVTRVVDSLLQHGRVARPYVGVGMTQKVPLPERLREQLKLPQASGLMLLSLEADGPADKAGLIIGDILLTLDGVAVADTDDVQAVLAGREAGASVGARILRGGEVKEVVVTPGERPARKRRG